jgi:regulator of replication initiation timing
MLFITISKVMVKGTRSQDVAVTTNDDEEVWVVEDAFSVHHRYPSQSISFQIGFHVTTCHYAFKIEQQTLSSFCSVVVMMIGIEFSRGFGQLSSLQASK